VGALGAFIHSFIYCEEEERVDRGGRHLRKEGRKEGAQLKQITLRDGFLGSRERGIDPCRLDGWGAGDNSDRQTYGMERKMRTKGTEVGMKKREGE